MQESEVKRHLIRAYPDLSSSELEDVLREARENPDAPWIAEACGRVIEPGLGSSLDAIAYGKAVEAIESGLPEHYSREDRFHEAIELLVSIALEPGNCRKTLDIIALAMGLHRRNGIDAVTLAKRYGVSKQAIIAEKNRMCERLGLLNQISGGRNNEARNKMRERNRSNAKLRPVEKPSAAGQRRILPHDQTRNGHAKRNAVRRMAKARAVAKGSRRVPPASHRRRD